LTITSELIPTGGTLPQTLLPVPISPSPRSRGIRRGLFLFLLALVIFPVLGMLSVFLLGNRPWPAGLVLFLLGGAGLLRVAYALMFEAGAPPPPPPNEGWPKAGIVGTADYRFRAADHRQLAVDANSQFAPAAGHWRETNDLEPGSVTDGTTKLLEKESDPPA
jgi:hypothetical protein